MGYYLSRFGNTQLPITEPITEMPTAPAQEGAVATLGYGYDAFGGDTAPAVFPYPLQYRVVVVGTTAAAYMSTINELRAHARKRNYVYRTGQDGAVHRALARLEQVSAQDSVETFNAVELAFRFLIWSHWENDWNAGEWWFDQPTEHAPLPQLYFDTGLFFDAAGVTTTLTTSPQPIVYTLGGNVAVDDAIITITAGSAAITAVTVACVDRRFSWTWTGTLAIGKSLVIDAGAWSVLNDGADAWAGFAFNSGHSIEGIAHLAAGANSIVVTLTGGGTGSTFGVNTPDRWA